MTAIKKTRGMVIKNTDFRDTSLIVTFFTRDFGRIMTVVKGIRKDYRKFGSHLNLFSINDIVFYEKEHSDFSILSQADLADAQTGIYQDIRRIAAATYLAELVDKTMPVYFKNEEVYDLLRQGCLTLQESQDTEKLMRVFEIKFLELSGFKPRLDACAHCQQLIKKSSRFSLHWGGLLCPRCFNKDQQARMITPGAIAAIIYVEKSAWDKLARLNLMAATSRELKQVLRDFLDFHIERKMKSVQFINSLN